MIKTQLDSIAKLKEIRIHKNFVFCDKITTNDLKETANTGDILLISSKGILSKAFHLVSHSRYDHIVTFYKHCCNLLVVDINKAEGL